jgi:ADP-dependent NAD(P)H-hydrate dehydratase / NAD(P)H-hydrate epimerase
MQVVTVAEMREIERRAEAEYSLDSPTLMEHAGRSVAEHLRAALGGDVTGRNVLILVGPGNNGGDGRVLGRYLAQWGAGVTSYAWKERRLEIAARLIPVGDDLAAVREAISRADVVADALLGTGNARPLEPSMRHLLTLLREERARRPSLFILGVDLPTGVNADSGAADEATPTCDLTVTLAYPKIGLFLFPAAQYVGKLEVGSIGLPPELRVDVPTEQLDHALLRPLLPPRPLDSNKGTFGKVMVLAGSPPYPGSAYLVATAAGRVGAGLVTMAVAPDLAPIYATKLTEATFHLLPPADADPAARADSLLAALPGYRALVAGPGLGQSDATRAFLDRLFAGLKSMPATDRPRLIVDADGLNNLSKLDAWWTRLPDETVITPHPGEMSRLLGGAKVSGGGADRLDAARHAREWGHVVVLKGATTLVASPDGRLRLNWPGNPALATAGTGDVLAGTVGGLLAQGMSPFDAASAAVYLHSRAGFLVSDKLGDAGLLAGDLLDQLPLALRETKRA